MADIERWITVNGVHIPIIKGESKARAVGRFIKGKIVDRKEKQREDYYQAIEKATGRKVYAGEKKIVEHHLKANNPIIKGEGTQKFKAKEAFWRGKQVEDKYRKMANEIEEQASKDLDERNKEVNFYRDAGNRAKARELRAKNQYYFQKERDAANQARLKGDWLNQETYNDYMSKPMTYKLKGKTEQAVTDYWNGNGKYQKQYNEVLKYQDEGKVPKGASGALNKLNNFGHRYYRYYNDGDMPRTEFKEYFGKDTQMPSSASRFRQYFPEAGVKGFNAYLEKKANTLIVTAHNRIKTLENKPASANRKLNSAYKKYLEEHPSSKISISEFNKWYK